MNEDSSMSDEGENSYVKLISSDGHEFLIKRRYAMASGTIRAMLNCPGNIRFILKLTDVVYLFIYRFFLRFLR